MIDFDGMNAFEATQEYGEATKELVDHLVGFGIPVDAIPGWIAGAVVTSLVAKLKEME